MARPVRTTSQETKKEREARIVRFVTAMVRRAEHETKPDRDRWAQNFQLFKGQQVWGVDRTSEGNEWKSQPFLHEFSVMCRRLADAMTDILFDKENFAGVEAFNPDDPGMTEFARITSKMIEHFNDRSKVSSLIYDALLGAAVTGLGVIKFCPHGKLYYTAETVLEEIAKEELATKKRLKNKVENSWETIPEDEISTTLLVEDAFKKVLGETSNVRRLLASKKRYELDFYLRNVSPLNFFYEPDSCRVSDSEWMAERIRMKFFQIESLFESNFFDQTKRKEILKLKTADSTTGVIAQETYEGEKLYLRDQLTDVSQYTPTVELLEYFGPLLAEDGSIEDENCHFVVAGGKVCLRDAKVSWYSQRPPFIPFICSPVPFKALGAGVADNAVDQQMLINELFAYFVDALKLAVYNPKCYDSSGIRNPEELENGIYPNMMIEAFKPARDIFSDIPITGINAAPVLFQTLEMLRLSGEKGAGIDVNSGNPASRARISAQEIRANMGRSGQSQNALARSLDENLVEPYVKMLVEYILQYALEKDALKDLLTYGVITQSEFNLLANIPPIERYYQAKAAVKIRVRGFRERLEKSDLLGRSMEFIQQFNAMPPEVRGMLDAKAMLKDIVDAFGFDGNRWLVQNNPQDKAREENRLLANDQQLSIAENDDDALHLPVHFEQIVISPNVATRAHIMGHLDRLQQRGAPLPEMSPEVQKALGLEEPSPAPKPPSKKRIAPIRDGEGAITSYEISEDEPTIQ